MRYGIKRVYGGEEETREFDKIYKNVRRCIWGRHVSIV